MKTDNLLESCSTYCDNIIRSSQEFASSLLLKKLPDGFSFHNLPHTQDVVNAVEILSLEENISKEEKGIVLIAAWFHDTGYTKCYFGHEAASQEIAAVFLRWQQFPEDKIAQVKACIAATKLGASATTSLEGILQDADLFHLGHPDYFRYLSRLRSELEVRLGKVLDDRQWFSKNIDFLVQHRYQTIYGRTVLEAKKQQNLVLNREALGDILG